MKDNKFRVMIGLGVMWLVLFVSMLCGAKIHPRVEYLVTFLCVGWFAFWTLSTIFKMGAKPKSPTVILKDETLKK